MKVKQHNKIGQMTHRDKILINSYKPYLFSHYQKSTFVYTKKRSSRCHISLVLFNDSADAQDIT